MQSEVAEAIALLKAQGIGVVEDASVSGDDVYVATVPDGEKYKLDAADLLNLKARQRLHLEGLQEVHLAKKGTPNL